MPNNIKKNKIVPDNQILIKGARVHNLKNVNLAIPRDKFVVITGLSGSGKSSLAFDTLYAEGQRRYVESLSAYARQFLGRMNKPDVDFIKGIPPAIAIEQKVNTRNPRSTVGTSTEIYDYLKLLYARVGKTFSPVSGKIVKRDRITDVVNHIVSYKNNTRVLILSPFIKKENRTLREQYEILLQQGFTRLEIGGKVHKINVLLKQESLPESPETYIVIDRIKVTDDEDTISRMADSADIAFYEGNGRCLIKAFVGEETETEEFSNRFERDGIVFDIPSVHTFSFNNPIGACPRCEGFGKIMGIDEDAVIPDKTLSVFDDAVACWRGPKMSAWKNQLIMNASKCDFPIHKPFYELTDEQKQVLWEGNQYFDGLNEFFAELERNIYKIQYRVMLSRYRGKTTCPECRGTRLKKEASYMKVGGKPIHDLVLMPIDKLKAFFDRLELSEHDEKVARRILIEINNRIMFLISVGLSYLTLNRLSSTLSGGESQRINLATSLGSSLVGSLYILDEPSIGLHPRDTNLLIGVLRDLQKIGNTVMVVEHDEEIIRAADQIIDIGPKAGVHGGEIVFQGTHKELLNNPQSLTTQYLTGERSIPLPKNRRQWNKSIDIKAAYENNLKNIDAKIPLNIFTVVCGVSGSGKSSLINRIFYAALKRKLQGYGEKPGKHATIQGSISSVENIEFVDQNPIGKSSRSNPITYIKAYDEIRKLFAEQQASKINNFTPSFFSFNTDGGRCEECQGEGEITVEMQFMADIHLVCDSCHGRRFKDEILDVKYRNKNIFDVLEMSVEEAIDFFSKAGNTLENRIVKKLQVLADVGLGYVKLGQSSSTLSGGESQRIKLASFLSLGATAARTIFVFDEPTTGLHFHDIQKLLQALNALIDKGHTVIVIEHNIEIIKSADWLIELGPEGGEKGGEMVFEGTPEDLVKCENSYTGQFLKAKI